jgi:hypothetical protein
VKNYPQNQALLAGRASEGELITGFRHALDQSYSRIFTAAANEWHRLFTGKDPSDACVSVRISGFRHQSARLRSSTGALQHSGAGAA